PVGSRGPSVDSPERELEALRWSHRSARLNQPLDRVRIKSFSSGPEDVVRAAAFAAYREIGVVAQCFGGAVEMPAGDPVFLDRGKQGRGPNAPPAPVGDAPP